MHYSTLQPTAAHCNTLRHTAAHYNALNKFPNAFQRCLSKVERHWVTSSCLRFVLGVYRALLSACRALLSVCSAPLSVCKTLLSEYTAVLSVIGVFRVFVGLFWVYIGLFSTLLVCTLSVRYDLRYVFIALHFHVLSVTWAMSHTNFSCHTRTSQSDLKML